MKTIERRQDKLQRLAARVTAGEVVFFIGAGFSLDSERNSTQVLIARLLARIEALTASLSQHPDSECADAARRLRKGLRTTFSLATGSVANHDEFGNLFDTTPAAGGRSILETNLSSLAQNYYLINDWACSAFEGVITRLAAVPPPKDLVAEVNRRENELLAVFHSVDPLKNEVRLAPFDLDWLICLYKYCQENKIDKVERSVAGKALFLETLGFMNEGIMGGKPMDPVFQAAVDGSSSRVRARHDTLAWLAAEGLCPILVTTNYDLLLESAYRAAGILPLNPPMDLWPDAFTPLQAAETIRLPVNARYRYYTRISNATEFFTHGDVQQAVLIHKMHGCVESYRIARRRRDPAMFRALLPTIVFTFREIQNWREDAWSRDYLSTLLRTRTVVFAGYSGADPVVHDTFRTVYEEMAGQNARMSAARMKVQSTAPGIPGANARAFFLDLEEKREFYGLEILRAAGVVEGETSLELSDHPNLLTFFRTGQSAFPNLDEMFCWLYHLAVRELQYKALTEELRRMAYQLFGRPCPENEAAAIVGGFRELCEQERRQARAFDLGARPLFSDAVRRGFQRLTGWTRGFHYRLLREYELGLSLLRNPNDSFVLQAISRFPWYRPLSEHPGWAAWGAVLELAIRRAAAAHYGRAAAWKRNGIHIEVAAVNSPTVLFRAIPLGPRDRSLSVRRCLTIQLSAMRQLFRQDPFRREMAALEPLIWRLQPETIPWWSETDDRRPPGTPSAGQLWHWAAMPPEQWSPEWDAQAVFGGASNGRIRQQTT